MTSFFIPAVSGNRRMRSGSVPVMQAAVPRVSAPNPPEVTIADSQLRSLAIRRPTASCNSSSRTKWRDMAAKAWTASGGINAAVSAV